MTLLSLVATDALVEAPVLDPEQLGALLYRVRSRAIADRALPTSFPAVAARVVDVLEQEDVDVNQLVRLVQQDVAITATLLGVANSAAMGVGRPVTEVRDAIVHLGTREVGAVAIGAAGRALFEPRSRVEFETFATLWPAMYQDALGAGLTADWLAHTLRAPGRESAFIAGMLRELGRPTTLRAIAGMVIAGEIDRPDDATVATLVDEAGPEVGRALIENLHLPPALAAVCDERGDSTPLTQIARLAAAAGALLAARPRPWRWASQAHDAATRLGLSVAQLRATLTRRGEDATAARQLATA